MIRTMLARALALGAALGGLSLAFGQGAAQAQADAAASLISLQARVDQLSARVAAHDALIVQRGKVTTIGDVRGVDELHLRTWTDPTLGLSMVGKDAVLRFARITLIADEVTFSAGQKISLKAPLIDLDGQKINLDGQKINAKATGNVPIKGSALREDAPTSVRVSGGKIEGN